MSFPYLFPRTKTGADSEHLFGLLSPQADKEVIFDTNRYGAANCINSGIIEEKYLRVEMWIMEALNC